MTLLTSTNIILFQQIRLPKTRETLAAKTRRRDPKKEQQQAGGRNVTTEEVGVFTVDTPAHDLLYEHCCGMFVIQTNCKKKKNSDTTRAPHNTAPITPAMDS